jgi:hypothetical protein
MRTTVSIDDELLAAAKRLARREGRTVGQVVEEALRRRLADDGAASHPHHGVVRPWLEALIASTSRASRTCASCGPRRCH